MSDDAQLAAEIEFDLRRFDEEMKRQHQQANVAATPLGQMVSIHYSILITLIIMKAGLYFDHLQSPIMSNFTCV